MKKGNTTRIGSVAESFVQSHSFFQSSCSLSRKWLTVQLIGSRQKIQASIANREASAKKRKSRVYASSSDKTLTGSMKRRRHTLDRRRGRVSQDELKKAYEKEQSEGPPFFVKICGLCGMYFATFHKKCRGKPKPKPKSEAKATAKSQARATRRSKQQLLEAYKRDMEEKGKSRLYWCPQCDTVSSSKSSHSCKRA